MSRTEASVDPEQRFFQNVFAGLKRWKSAYDADGAKVSCYSRDEYASYLWRKARAAAREYPDLEFWEIVPEVLKDGLEKFDSEKGRFDRLFLHNLKERLKRNKARLPKARSLRRVPKELDELPARPGNLTDQRDSFSRWARRLVALALADADDLSRDYWELRPYRIPVRLIAHAHGVTERYLRNRYGGQKFDSFVRKRIKKLIRRLTADQQRQLARHLEEHAELSPSEVQLLLGVPVNADASIPLLGEVRLLKLLGWESSR